MKGYDFLSIISNKFGHICQCYQITTVGNMLDLELTSPGHSRSKQMSPNERPYMPFYPSLIINLAVSARVSKLRPSEICLTWIDPSRSLKVKDNGAIWNLRHDFLSIIKSNSVVILNRFGDIGHWKPVWPGSTFQGHSRSKTMVPNET